MLTFNDFDVGRVFEFPSRTVTEEEIIEFAKEFDPQPFHTDPDSEEAKAMGGLIASGWHTSSIWMRMMCDAYLLDTASQGSPGLEEVRWHRPVRPGDTLYGTAEVMGARVSKSREEIGLLDLKYEMHNQHGEIVMTSRGSGMVDVARD